MKKELIMTGVPVSKGSIVARVRVVDGDKTKLAKLTKGEVVVAVRTDPWMNPYLQKADAIIADIGGVTSHSGIWGREQAVLRGKAFPVVTGTQAGGGLGGDSLAEEATKILKTGDMVVIDATGGTLKSKVVEGEKEGRPLGGIYRYEYEEGDEKKLGQPKSFLQSGVHPAEPEEKPPAKPGDLSDMAKKMGISLNQSFLDKLRKRD